MIKTMSPLNELAVEMINLAESKHISISQMGQNILAGKGVDAEYCKEFEGLKVSFTCDDFSPEKYMRHLSIGSLNCDPISDEVKEKFRDAFFGREKVMEIPSLHGKRVVQFMCMRSR